MKIVAYTVACISLGMELGGCQAAHSWPWRSVVLIIVLAVFVAAILWGAWMSRAEIRRITGT